MIVIESRLSKVDKIRNDETEITNVFLRIYCETFKVSLDEYLVICPRHRDLFTNRQY